MKGDLSERLNRLEHKVDQNHLMLQALCERQLIDTSSIPGFSPLPLLSRSNSPGAATTSSPGLGVSNLALSDTHSNASTRSSGKSDKPCKSEVFNPCR